MYLIAEKLDSCLHKSDFKANMHKNVYIYVELNNLISREISFEISALTKALM